MQNGHFRSHLLLEVTQPGGAGAGPARGGGGEGQVPVMVPNPLVNLGAWPVCGAAKPALPGKLPLGLSRPLGPKAPNYSDSCRALAGPQQQKQPGD